METDDIDVFVNYSIEPPSLQELNPIYSFLAEKVHPKKEYVVIHDWDVQFLLAVQGSLPDEALLHSNIFDFGGVEIRVIIPEYLVAIMLKTSRGKDFIRAKKFVDESLVDPEQLSILIERFELKDKWQRLKQL